MNKQAIVEIENLSFTYGCHTVLSNTHLTINSSDVVCISGPNGAGKTTLIKLVLGQLQPTTGSVKLFGTEASKLRERYRIGYLSQKATHFNLQFPATAREIVLSGLVPKKGLFKQFLKKDYLQVDNILELVGMREIANHLIGNLSGGQQQRILLARALISEPELLILDEPSTGVDIYAQESMYRLLGELNQKQGITMLIVSHELEAMASIITHQVCLDKRLCTCSCHNYPNPEMGFINCRRMNGQQPTNQQEPCYGNFSI